MPYMTYPLNPFIVAGRIEPEYFCDRLTESRRLIKSVTNGNNIVLISPRRMGKTGLIQYCYDQPEISNAYYTFFVDILHTSSLREFTYMLGREIFRTLLPFGRRIVARFVSAIRSVSGKFGFDPMTGTPTFNLELGDIERPEYTLEEIFLYLAEADRPCIVAIDEFQQVARYPEKNIEALLRSHIQRLRNCHFIFAGSERHMMQEMFTSSARPFYHSADLLELKAIPPSVYVPFVVGHFEKRHRTIDPADVERVYEMFQGHTYYIQKAFNEAFSDTPEGACCTIDVIRRSIDTIVESNDTIFREILSNIPEKQKQLLYAIARDGEAKAITSAAFIRRHSLSSASSVQSALLRLVDKDIVSCCADSWTINDRLFALWLRRLYGAPTHPLASL